MDLGVGWAGHFITGTEVQWSHINPSYCQMTSLSLTDVLIFLNDRFGHKLKTYSMIEWKKNGSLMVSSRQVLLCNRISCGR